EFNEFASYFLTREARRAAIEVNDKRAQADQLEKQAAGLEKQRHDTEGHLTALKSALDRSLQDAHAAYERRRNAREDTYRKSTDALRARLPADSASAGEAGTMRELQARLENVERDRDKKLQEIAARYEDDVRGATDPLEKSIARNVADKAALAQRLSEEL